MNCVKITDYGIVVRAEAIHRLGLTVLGVSELLEFDGPFDDSVGIISFGPCFGEEASDEFCRRLEKVGFIYFDDFFVFSGGYPSWCGFKVGLSFVG